jgi:hypothetical protein
MNDTRSKALTLGECNSGLILAFQLSVARCDARARRTREAFPELPIVDTVLYGIIKYAGRAAIVRLMKSCEPMQVWQRQRLS